MLIGGGPAVLPPLPSARAAGHDASARCRDGRGGGAGRLRRDARRLAPAGDEEQALAYLRQAVVNRSRSVLRHRTVPGDNPEPVLPDTPGADHEASGLLEQPAARAALGGLPERQREAIVLLYYAGLPEREIAAAMDISRGA